MFTEVYLQLEKIYPSNYVIIINDRYHRLHSRYNCKYHSIIIIITRSSLFASDVRRNNDYS